MYDQNDPLTTLIRLFGRLPGVGPRSARRMVLHLLKNRELLMQPLASALTETAQVLQSCSICGNWDVQSPCKICTDPKRDTQVLCVVESVSDLWAMERSASYRGQYHVLGGTLSALSGATPEDLRIGQLLERCQNGGISEVILATNATLDGQTTAHYISEHLSTVPDLKITRLAQGMPFGGELDYLDDGTLTTALAARLAL